MVLLTGRKNFSDVSYGYTKGVAYLGEVCNMYVRAVTETKYVKAPLSRGRLGLSDTIEYPIQNILHQHTMIMKPDHTLSLYLV